MSAPYRESDPPPRYLCIVCWRTASPVEGVCCGVPMPLIEGRQSIVEELRARGRAKKVRPERRRLAFAAAAAGVLAVALHAVLLGLRVYDPDPHRGSWMGHNNAAGLILMLVFLTFLGLYLPLSFLARRMIPPAEGAGKLEPDTASVPELVEWLGIAPKDK